MLIRRGCRSERKEQQHQGGWHRYVHLAIELAKAIQIDHRDLAVFRDDQSRLRQAVQCAIDTLSGQSDQVRELFLRYLQARLRPRIQMLVEQRRELVRQPGFGTEESVVLHHSNELAKPLVQLRQYK